MNYKKNKWKSCGPSPKYKQSIKNYIVTIITLQIVYKDFLGLFLLKFVFLEKKNNLKGTESTAIPPPRIVFSLQRMYNQYLNVFVKWLNLYLILTPDPIGRYSVEFQSQGHNLLRTPHTVFYRRSWPLWPGFALIQSKKKKEHRSNQFHHRTCNIRGCLRTIVVDCVI